MASCRPREKVFWRPVIIIVLELTLIVPAATAKQRRGAELVVTKKDGQAVQGELLAVRGIDLILRTGAGRGVTVSLKEVDLSLIHI